MSETPQPPYDPWRRPGTDAPAWGPTAGSYLPDADAADTAGVGAAGTDLTGSDLTGADPLLDTLGRPLPTPRQAPSPRTLFVAAVVLALVAGLLGGALGAWLADRRSSEAGVTNALTVTPVGSTSRPPDSVAGIAGRVLPVVVSIEVRSGDTGGTGSGFLIRSDGYVLTNNHVVAGGADGGTITVRFNDGTTAAGTIVGRSPAYDVAVVHVDRSGLPVATLGNSDSVVVGDTAIAVGSPLGLAGTVTSGIISAVHRPVTTGADDGTGRSYFSALQTDAAINPGNSGGPLVDGEGRVIGVNSAIATLPGTQAQSGSIGLGFSIPINQARRVADQLIRTGSATYPIIGARLDQAYNGTGARLADVTAGGPAARAGMRAGDVVVEVDGGEVSTAEELIVAVRSHQPGQQVEVAYERGGGRRTVRVTLGEATG